MGRPLCDLTELAAKTEGPKWQITPLPLQVDRARDRLSSSKDTALGTIPATTMLALGAVAGGLSLPHVHVRILGNVVTANPEKNPEVVILF